jgi:hypothetical protein
MMWQAVRLALVAAALRGVGAQTCSPGAAQAPCNSVLVIHTDDPGFSSDVQSQLQGTGAFAKVDTFDARFDTPTAEKLAAYHAILVFSDDPFSDATLLGDRLADYHDQGGGVVVTTFANADNNFARLQGAYGDADNGYALLDYGRGELGSGGYIGPPGWLGKVLEPQSPLLNGVASFSAAFAYRSTAAVVSDRGIVVAMWSTGVPDPLVVRGVRGDRSLVELNFFPVSMGAYSAGWTGDGAALLRNALKYSRCIYGLLSCGPGNFSVAGEARRREGVGT